jgi:hypothetical protein
MVQAEEETKFSSACLALEADMADELNLPGHILPGRFTEECVGEISYRHGEIDAVEGVEELATHVEAACVAQEGQAKGSCHGHVGLGKTGTVVDVASKIALLARGWDREFRGGEYTLQEVGAVGTQHATEGRRVGSVVSVTVRVVIAPGGVGGRRIDVVGIAGLQDHDRRHREVFSDRIEETFAHSGDMPDGIRREAVASVIVGAGVLAFGMLGVKDVLSTGDAVIVAAWLVQPWEKWREMPKAPTFELAMPTLRP